MSRAASIDFETRSAVNLPKMGLYKYVEHPTTDVWCMAYAFDDGPVNLWQRGQVLPRSLQDHVAAGGIVRAWNAAFERIMWNGVLAKKQGWPILRMEQVHCTMAQAMTNGLPAALDKCSQALGVTMQKDQDGRKLMLKMCQPRLLQADGSCLWWDDIEDQARLGAYCRQDVEVERAIFGRLRPMLDSEREIYLLDQVINDRGMALDNDLVHTALMVVTAYARHLDEDVRELTAGMVGNTRKRRDLLNWLWLHSEIADDLTSIDRYALVEILKRDDLTAIVRAVLQIRLEAMKSSTAKLTVMQRAVNTDGRIRGQLRYYGARQTGRWAGTQMQPHNLPRGHIEPNELEGAVEAIKEADREVSVRKLQILYGPPLDVVSSILRGCIVAHHGRELFVVDWNAIEARVLAWLAHAAELLAIFREGGDPYKRMAANVFQCIEQAVDEQMRWVGKQLVLSCGYGTGWRTFKKRIAREGIDIDAFDARNYIATYRENSEEIVGLWGAIEGAAKAAIRNPGVVFRNKSETLSFGVKGEVLYMKLPSGRFLCYLRPAIEKVEMEIELDDGSKELVEREQIRFWGVSPFTHQWWRNSTYGAKLVENAVQAISRDILAAAMVRCERAGFPIILHVHDEIVAEVAIGARRLSDFIALASEAPAWAADCPLAVKGWQGLRYRK